MYPRNAASPEPVAVGAVVQISDGSVQTSGVTVRIKPVGVAEADGAGTTAYTTDGVVLYTPTQAETNYTSFVLVAKKAGCIPASATVVTTASATAGYAGVDWAKVANPTATVALSGTTVRADVRAWGGVTASVSPVTNLPLVSVFSLYDAANATESGFIATNTIDFDTIQNNLNAPVSSRAPASTALDATQWTSALATALGTLASHDPGATLASRTNITAASGVALTGAYDAAKTAAQPSDVPTDAANATAVLAATVAELSAVPGASPTVAQALALLYMALRNELTVTTAAKTVHTDAGTALGAKALTDDGTTYAEAKLA
jgi:hypothetical protein